MHSFDDLIYRNTVFTLNILEETRSKVLEELQKTGSSNAVKNLQAIQLQKAIIAVGMFSLFESMLQEGLTCRNGFSEAKKILLQAKNIELINRFDDFICAINVLKHGKGKSYNALIERSTSLPFRIKGVEENFFDEGDTSEVATLIEVNDQLF